MGVRHRPAAIAAAFILAASCLAAVVGRPQTAHAAGKTYVVNENTDAADSSLDLSTLHICATLEPPVGTAPACSLRAAVQANNADGGGNTIQLTGGQTYTLSLTEADETDASGELRILRDATIVVTGSGLATITGNKGWNDRIVQVVPGKHLTMSNLVLQHGRVDGPSDCCNTGDFYDGGILLNYGTVQATNVTFTDGRCIGCEGGAVDNHGTLTLTNSTVSDGHTDPDDNGSTGPGGGINNGPSSGSGGILTMNGGALSGNTAGADCNNDFGAGGGLYNLQSATLSGVTVNDNHASCDGGGITNDNASNEGSPCGTPTSLPSMTATDLVITNNVAALSGGGLHNYPNYGGVFTFTRLKFVNNTALQTALDFSGVIDHGGGAIYDDFGLCDNAVSPSAPKKADPRHQFASREPSRQSTTIPKTTPTVSYTDIWVENNHAPSGAGGGIFAADRVPVTWLDLTVDNNTAAVTGGGIFSDRESVATFTNATITGNSARDGGGVRLGTGGDGFPVGSLTLLNDTINANNAFGGASTEAGGLEVLASPAPLTVKNTIISANTSGSFSSNCIFNTTATIVDGGHNVVDNSTCSRLSSGAGDQVVAPPQPLLGALTNNGGFAPTEAIPQTSAAWNTADNNGCPATDERHVTRPQNGVCDVGAFELVVQAPPPPPVGNPGGITGIPNTGSGVGTARGGLLVATGLLFGAAGFAARRRRRQA